MWFAFSCRHIDGNHKLIDPWGFVIHGRWRRRTSHTTGQDSCTGRVLEEERYNRKETINFSQIIQGKKVKKNSTATLAQHCIVNALPSEVITVKTNIKDQKILRAVDQAIQNAVEDQVIL